MARSRAALCLFRACLVVLPVHMACQPLDVACASTDLICNASLLALRSSPPSLVVSISGTPLASGDTLAYGPVGFGASGTYKQRSFELRNTGAQTLLINGTIEVATSSGFTITSPPVSTIPGGDSAGVTVRYVAVAASTDAATLAIPSNDSVNPRFTVNLNGSGVGVGTGLTVYFSLDGNLSDQSGNGFNGTPQGSLSYTGGRGGVPGTALVMDGGGANYFQATFAPGWAFNATFSVSAWVRTSAAFSILSRGFTGVGTTQFDFGHSAPNYVVSRDSFSAGGWVQTTIPGTHGFGEWQHIAFVSTAGNVSLYRNGAQVGSGMISAANTPGAGSTTVNFGQGILLPNLTGTLDDVRIYNTTALSPAQVQALYNQD